MPNYIVYYKMLHNKIDEFNLPSEIDSLCFFWDWKPMRVVEANSLDEVYEAMQGDNWSPNGEARELVINSGTGHTSMMVGDVIGSLDGKFWMVDNIGFKEITLTNK